MITSRLGICYYHANNLLCHDLIFLFWILETVFNHLKLLHFLFANEISMAQGSVQEVRKTNGKQFREFHMVIFDDLAHIIILNSQNIFFKKKPGHKIFPNTQ